MSSVGEEGAVNDVDLSGMNVGRTSAEWGWRLTQVRNDSSVRRESGEGYDDGGGFPVVCVRVAKLAPLIYNCYIQAIRCLLCTKYLPSRTFGDAGIFGKMILA